MGQRQLVLVITVVLVVVAALVATQRASTHRVSTFTTASMDVGAPVAPRPTATPAPQAPSAPAQQQQALVSNVAVQLTPAPIEGLAPSAGNEPAPQNFGPPSPPTAIDFTDASGDLRNSQERLNAIDSISQEADTLFAPVGDAGSWSVNQQDMDQQDYQTSSGAITKWFSEDGVSRAEEAQLNNGELVDRWYHDDGSVEQVMHQYDKRNSYSVYYYANGKVEATRVIRDGNEVFTKYDPDGREIQRTYTPASD